MDSLDIHNKHHPIKYQLKDIWAESAMPFQLNSENRFFFLMSKWFKVILKKQKTHTKSSLRLPAFKVPLETRQAKRDRSFITETWSLFSYWEESQHHTDTVWILYGQRQEREEEYAETHGRFELVATCFFVDRLTGRLNATYHSQSRERRGATVLVKKKKNRHGSEDIVDGLSAWWVQVFPHRCSKAQTNPCKLTSVSFSVTRRM